MDTTQENNIIQLRQPEPDNKIQNLEGDSPGRRSIRKFLHHRLAVLGAIVLVLITLSAVFAPLLSQHSPTDLDLRNANSAPSAIHWLGTDATGRDTWARVILGGRVSLAVGIIATTISTGIGILFGLLSGYYRGKVDMVIMRFTDMVMSFPTIIGIIVLVSILEPGIFNTMLAIGLFQWTTIARLVRGNVLSLRETEYVQAAHALGASDARIIFRHILPNTISAVLVAATLSMSSAILMESGLSFLGLGVQPPTPSWGNMLQQARNYTVLETLPWLWIPPGVAIMLTVLSINFIGDGLNDALNPRQQD
ncbi:ABC transporter permease [Phototrophicus methaneseepsis]|uniref:ABC transporter permease n=1 Tax=Phototrophicus methaneseepsis TaxID=2710758 RepID=A0A7S8E542_9CHLR|nr:oligopeptide ABC transporter permease [Phototrophicus methaneseepsis]QPC80527.1 ABC transporter permease [Phototrophicus methaneseepsis]